VIDPADGPVTGQASEATGTGFDVVLEAAGQLL
jgi:hypothetical protein